MQYLFSLHAIMAFTYKGLTSKNPDSFRIIYYVPQGIPSDVGLGGVQARGCIGRVGMEAGQVIGHSRLSRFPRARRRPLCHCPDGRAVLLPRLVYHLSHRGANQHLPHHQMLLTISTGGLGRSKETYRLWRTMAAYCLWRPRAYGGLR